MNESAAMPNPVRTDDQTKIGIFWAYDGGYRIGVPPRLYNSIADDITIDYLGKGDPNMATGLQLVKLYALVNVVLGDAGIAVRAKGKRQLCHAAIQRGHHCYRLSHFLWLCFGVDSALWNDNL
jgi:hypothetical protein